MSEPPRPADLEAAEQAADQSDAAAELLLRAAYNYHVFLAAMVGFAKEHGESAAVFFRWTAERVGGTWQGLQGHGADAVLRLVLENLASTGYSVPESAFDAEVSTAAVRAVPLGLDDEQWRRLIGPFGAEPADMLRLFEIFVPLVASAGAVLTLNEEAGVVRMTVRRSPPTVGPQPVRFFDL